MTIAMKCFLFFYFCIVSLGGAAFFVKEFKNDYGRGRCINDTGQIQSSGSWGNLSFLEFSQGSCLDSSAQFRFRENGAMLNLQRQGCLAAFNKDGSGYNLDMFYLYVDSVSLDAVACAQKPSEGIYRNISQTSIGGLSVHYKGKRSSSFQTWCAIPHYNYERRRKYGIEYYIILGRIYSNRCYFKFIFGKLNNFVYKQGITKKGYNPSSVACHCALITAWVYNA